VKNEKEKRSKTRIGDFRITRGRVLKRQQDVLKVSVDIVSSVDANILPHSAERNLAETPAPTTV